jgi:ubiquinone/menaquinone biosynthesis C-methylase UbiE
MPYGLACVARHGAQNSDVKAENRNLMEALFVPETRFGFWFLGTRTWETRVIRVALADLLRLQPEHRWPRRPVILDVGCGQGKSFKPLHEIFAPQRIVAIDFERECLERAAAAAEGLPVDLRRGDLSALELADESVDLIFCHQTFHHLTRQREALAEFYRVLKPGGLFLFAESTRAYICSWIIRLLFRHPMEAQHSADEYIEMIRARGFEVSPENCSFPYLWWSRSDLGLRERIGVPPPKPGAREETLINLVATKPVR